MGRLDNQKPTWHRPETTNAKTIYVAADRVKKRDCPPLLEGGVKETADEGEYKIFTISSLCRNDISATVFYHFTILTCVYSLHHCTILVSTFNHTDMKMFFVTPFHHCVSPFHHVKLCALSASLYHIRFIIVPY